MNILTYIQSLLPTFGKDRVLEDLRLARTELQDLRPTIKEAAKVLTKVKSKHSQELNRFATGLSLGYKSNDTIFSFLSNNINNVIDHIDLLERLAKQELPDTIASKGLDLRQVNLVQLSEAISFVSEFTHFLCVFLTRNEYIEITTEKKLESNSSNLPYEQEVFENGYKSYLIALRVLTKPVKDTETALANIPQIIAAGVDYNVLRATTGAARMDVGQLAAQGFEWNPIYHVRLSIVERRELRYREAKAQLACFQLQLQRCKVAVAGKQDARLDREIAYLEREIRATSSEIEDLK